MINNHGCVATEPPKPPTPPLSHHIAAEGPPAPTSGTMAGWKSLLVAYLLGGVTFIPLSLIAVAAIFFYTLPARSLVDSSQTSDADDLVLPGDDTTDLDAAKKASKEGTKPRANNDLDVAAGYFAVCREYTPMGINAKPIERSTPVGSTTVASPSPSVYQTMYRSIFERKPTPGPLDSSTNSTSVSQRPKKAGNVFYVVLRHGHLMLFDDDEQVEVRHVISLAHHDISVYSGGGKTLEGELFIKRNALCLTRKQNSPEKGPDSQISKPFYLFSENCSAKEDFYFSLLKNQELTFGNDKKGPVSMQFDVKNIISLVQKLHSTEDNMHSRWINALLGRIFLGIYKTRDLENYIREKLTIKISRVKRPSFLTNITIQQVYTGDSAPYFTNMKLRDLTVEGECVVEADVKYTGNFRIEVAATVKIDLGTRFKAREVNLVLAVVLKRAEGHMFFKIKPPPSNRVWFAFQTMPKVEMAIEPIVSSRQITYTVILRQIENRIKEVMAETFVLPFWDDVPFFKTEHKNWRGGIFEGDDATVPSEEAEMAAAQAAEASQAAEVAQAAQTGDVAAVQHLDESPDVMEETRPMEKSHTIPVMESSPVPTGLFGRKLNKAPTSLPTSASSTSIESKGANPSPSLSPKIIRKATEPIVGTDAAHADIFKPSSSPPDHATNFMAALQSRSQDASPRPATADPPTRPASLLQHSSGSSSSSKEVLDGDAQEDTNKMSGATGRRNTTSSAGSSTFSEERGPASSAASTKDSIKSQTGSLGRNFFMRRENTEATVSDAASVNSDSSQKRNTLAAVTNAAAQARQWGWNAIQRQKEARRQADQANHVDLSQPMGRGQPLPPPGTPLPRPTNGMTKISAPVPVPVRKPVGSQSSARTSAESLESHHEHRPPPLPSMPPRRRRGQSHDFGAMPEVSEGQNILVVAAPSDSQPNTPLTEDLPSVPSWTREASDDQTLADSEGSQQTSAPVREPSIAEKEEDGSNSPIEALPASSTPDDDDDDDYSGWMDNDVLEVEMNEPMQAPIPQEVK
ncbi:hypothetical protein G7Z17_g7117 [Cylindrodendrum hubeiense]|uniref:SMP-LTD domain-containing protein n=1 Tax=Cylindrodendrum hubeiense TaxID=595255 RepID=A0A9P5H3J0_9HYPO|nr:hypothetical protein G7Z17_g7117 [Cylindrodendrum hubeiense]